MTQQTNGVLGDWATLEEKVRWLEAQNILLRFHYTALMEHVSGSSPGDVAKKRDRRRPGAGRRGAHGQRRLSDRRNPEMCLLPRAQALGEGRERRGARQAHVRHREREARLPDLRA